MRAARNPRVAWFRMICQPIEGALCLGVPGCFVVWCFEFALWRSGLGLSASGPKALKSVVCGSPCGRLLSLQHHTLAGCKLAEVCSPL